MSNGRKIIAMNATVVAVVLVAIVLVVVVVVVVVPGPNTNNIAVVYHSQVKKLQNNRAWNRRQ